MGRQADQKLGHHLCPLYSPSFRFLPHYLQGNFHARSTQASTCPYADTRLNVSAYRPTDRKRVFTDYPLCRGKDFQFSSAVVYLRYAVVTIFQAALTTLDNIHDIKIANRTCTLSPASTPSPRWDPVDNEDDWPREQNWEAQWEQDAIIAS